MGKSNCGKKHVIVMMDINIDTSNSGHNKSWNVENLKTVLFDFLNHLNVYVHNKNYIF